MPFPIARFQHLAAERWPSRRRPTFTMHPDRLFAALLRQHPFVTCFRTFAESIASDHTSGVETMQAAERSIDDKLEEIGAEFRCRREDEITAKLLQSVSGFEALRAREGER